MKLLNKLSVKSIPGYVGKPLLNLCVAQSRQTLENHCFLELVSMCICVCVWVPWVYVWVCVGGGGGVYVCGYMHVCVCVCVCKLTFLKLQYV